MLRAPLGLQWVVGALLAGVAVLVAGILLLTSSGPPERPWVRTVAIDEVDGAVVAVDVDALVVTGGGPAMAFADQAGRELGWCGATRRVEGLADGQPATWQAGTGRGFGVRSLDSHPIVVHDGIVYVDPTRRRPGPRPTPDREGPTCR